ncbi:MAG: methyltransferase domain-containing protein [Anaerolineae bacterium]|nr:methyltransferase domain-containing protein [Anaerolineae bacterium]
MQEFLLSMLECPLCHGDLRWRIEAGEAGCIDTATATCTDCEATYPIREGIGLFLTPELPRDDLWEQVGSNLSHFLDTNPDTARALLDGPLDALNPADQFLRAMALEDRGEFAAARRATASAWPGLYTPEYRTCAEQQLRFVVDQVNAQDSDAPIVDIACGRGQLIERLAEHTTRPIVATDFSPRVLRRNRRYFEHLHCCDQVNFLACDARLTPFKTGAVQVMTSNLGLQNISEPGNLLAELRRVLNPEGVFLAISYFYPPDDVANEPKLTEYGLLDILERERALELFRAAGWQVELASTCTGYAQPTPTSGILGMGIDGLPVAPTTLTWGTVVARG